MVVLRTFVTISSVVGLFERPERSSSQTNVGPRLNSEAHIFTVENEGEL